MSKRAIESDSNHPVLRIRLPEITLTNPKQLPPDALAKCEKELQEMMKEYIGKVTGQPIAPTTLNDLP